MVTLKKLDTGLIKECPTGYSWTTFFFGMFVPLLRGDLKWAAILFAISLLVGFLTAGLGAFLVPIVFAGFYNKMYIQSKLEQGFVAANEASEMYLVGNGYIIK